MESQPQNPEFRNKPENFHPCVCCTCSKARQNNFSMEANAMNPEKTAGPK